MRDFIDEWKNEIYPVKNYADWLIANFGRTFAETFPMEYTVKYHTTTADNMTTDWIGPRMYKPKIEEVLLGALTQDHPIIHYVTEFRYPSRDGFVSYLKMFLEKTELKIGHQVANIDPRRKELGFSDGNVVGYNGLISSIPLPDLIPMVKGVPADVQMAAGKLACSACVIVNIGIDREDISEAQISYFYDRDIMFSRLSFPHMFSPHNAPPGKGSIQAEVYFSPKYKPLDRSPEEFIPLVIADLRRCGIIREYDKVIFSNAIYAPYANVIFDHDRANALKTVHGYLEDIGIAYCGRYGDWGYMWTDESFISGERAARKILNGY
jgi:protoporphyrinogen oxidase